MAKKKDAPAADSPPPVEPEPAAPAAEAEPAPAAEAPSGPKEKKKRYPRGGFQSDGKKIINARKGIDRLKRYPLAEAVDLLFSHAPKRKFDETVELVMKLGVDPRKQGQALRGSIALPKGVGKTNRVICFAEGAAAEDARAAGAVEVGMDDLAKKIEEGWDAFDKAIAHPGAMRVVGRLGKILGPKGKMPTPKEGTVTADVGNAVKEYIGGKIAYRTDDHGNVHVAVGKRSFKKDDLIENITSFIAHIQAIKPSDQKGIYIQKVVLSSTMGPGVPVQVGGGGATS